MKEWRLLVCRPTEEGPDQQINPAQLDAALARAGHPCALAPMIVGEDSPGMAAALERAEVVLGWRIPIALMGAHGAGVRLIQVTNAGIDNLLPLTWLPAHTALCNARGIHAAKLQEWAGMALLMLHAQMPHYATAQRAGAWSRRPMTRIAGHTVAVFGTGALGSAVARAARQLGLATLGIRRSPGPADGFDSVAGLDQRNDVLARADFVVLTLPLTDGTRGLADAGFFAAMKPGAGFANFGRGALVDQEALCAALARGTPGGAIIDVTSPEPLPAGSPLWSAPNLIITPHVSCDDPGRYVPDALDLLMENLRRLERGEMLVNRVDPRLGY